MTIFEVLESKYQFNDVDKNFRAKVTEKLSNAEVKTVFDEKKENLSAAFEDFLKTHSEGSAKKFEVELCFDPDYQRIMDAKA
jgi:hypothetical protein